MLKITELKNALLAAETHLELHDDFSVYDLASKALFVEECAARALREKYYTMPETDCASGITNARDTFAGVPDAEYSTEFWTCAIESLQLMRDFGDVTGL